MHSIKKPFYKKKIFILSLVALATLIIGVGVYLVMFQKDTQQQAIKPETQVVTQVEPKKEQPVFFSPLTGIKTTDQSFLKKPTVAVMIENSPSARPHSGLKQAGIVYETVAEGGITRFLALYHQQEDPSTIGPVRSLRPYYIDWLTPYDPIVAHVGGSAEALATIRNGSYNDLDEFFNTATYTRASDRYAPHNVYTTIDQLIAAGSAKKMTYDTYIGIARKNDDPAKKPTAQTISVPFSGFSYNTSYRYNSDTNTYARYLAGQKHIDREKGAITPKSVVVLKVAISHTTADGGREIIQTIGTGSGYIFQDGTVTPITWEKKTKKTPLSFRDTTGTTIALNRGQTWIAAVPNYMEVTWE